MGGVDHVNFCVSCDLYALFIGNKFIMFGVETLRDIAFSLCMMIINFFTLAIKSLVVIAYFSKLINFA